MPVPDFHRSTYAPGGRSPHDSRTDIGVRWTHVPSGIFAESHTERTQAINERIALLVLAHRLRKMGITTEAPA